MKIIKGFFNIIKIIFSILFTLLGPILFPILGIIGYVYYILPLIFIGGIYSFLYLLYGLGRPTSVLWSILVIVITFIKGDTIEDYLLLFSCGALVDVIFSLIHAFYEMVKNRKNKEEN